MSLAVGLWPAMLAGMTPREAMTDAARASRAYLDFTLRFDPDTACETFNGAIPASVLEELDYKLYAWPGHGVAETEGFQFKEEEWMLAEEYDHLISDPTDYMLRKYLPRGVGAFAGFSNVSSLFDFAEIPFVSGHMRGWGSDEMVESLERLGKAARSAREWGQAMSRSAMEMAAHGYPPYRSGATKAPFDLLGDTLRGTRGILLDMFRRPEKVLAACERLVPVAIDWVLKRPGGPPPTPVVFMPLHKGADGFMSDEQFRTFYWPTLLAVINGLVDEGYIPLLFAEGRFSSRLEIITEVPKGKTVWLFDQTDMARAKETVGRVACLQGNVPMSMIHAGTPAETAEYVRGLIDSAGQGGGLIVDFGAVAYSGKVENLDALVKTVKEYGSY